MRSKVTFASLVFYFLSLHLKKTTVSENPGMFCPNLIFVRYLQGTAQYDVIFGDRATLALSAYGAARFGVFNMNFSV